MLARLRVLLPYAFSIPAGEPLEASSEQMGDYLVTIHPPMPLIVDPQKRVASVTQGLDKTLFTEPSDEVTVNGVPTYSCNVVQIDFNKPEFDRKRRDPENFDGINADPPVQFMFGLVNSLLERIRGATAATHVKPLDPNTSVWLLSYFTDEGEQLEQDLAVRRGLGNNVNTDRVVTINQTNWSRIIRIPTEFENPVWWTIRSRMHRV